MDNITGIDDFIMRRAASLAEAIGAGPVGAWLDANLPGHPADADPFAVALGVAQSQITELLRIIDGLRAKVDEQETDLGLLAEAVLGDVGGGQGNA